MNLSADRKLVERRRRANMQILDLLREFFERYPEQRFGQALVNLGLVELAPQGEHLVAKDPHNEEPEAMLARLVRNFPGESR